MKMFKSLKLEFNENTCARCSLKNFCHNFSIAEYEWELIKEIGLKCKNDEMIIYLPKENLLNRRF